MKTNNGYTSEAEARKEPRTKYVVWYRINPGGDTFYVSFTNRKDAEQFAAGKQRAGLCGEEE